MIEAHQKGAAYELVLPIVDESDPASFLTSAAFTAVFYFKDGAGAWSTFVPADAFAEIGATGVYEISLSAAEMDHDYVLCIVSGAAIADSMVKIDMTGRDSDVVRRFVANDNVFDPTAAQRTIFDDDGVTTFATITTTEPTVDTVKETVT